MDIQLPTMASIDEEKGTKNAGSAVDNDEGEQGQERDSQDGEEKSSENADVEAGAVDTDEAQEMEVSFEDIELSGTTGAEVEMLRTKDSNKDIELALEDLGKPTLYDEAHDARKSNVSSHVSSCEHLLISFLSPRSILDVLPTGSTKYGETRPSRGRPRDDSTLS